MIPAERFYAAEDGPLKQGDILLAGVSRLVAEDRFSPPAWEHLDGNDVTAETGDGRDLLLAAGVALTMVTSHDCHFDKEWNLRRGKLIRAGVAAEAAERQVGADLTLDRTFLASPLIRPGDVDRDQTSLLAGKVLGYLPVPASADGLVPESVVDLTYRVTLDRLDVRRLASVSNEVRMHLRYGLARLDSLRATSVGFELERIVGKQITEVSLLRENPLLVRLHLGDGQRVVDLFQQPSIPLNPIRPGPDVPLRQRIPKDGAHEHECSNGGDWALP